MSLNQPCPVAAAELQHNSGRRVVRDEYFDDVEQEPVDYFLADAGDAVCTLAEAEYGKTDDDLIAFLMEELLLPMVETSPDHPVIRKLADRYNARVVS